MEQEEKNRIVREFARLAYELFFNCDFLSVSRMKDKMERIRRENERSWSGSDVRGILLDD